MRIEEGKESLFVSATRRFIGFKESELQSLLFATQVKEPLENHLFQKFLRYQIFREVRALKKCGAFFRLRRHFELLDKSEAIATHSFKKIFE